MPWTHRITSTALGALLLLATAGCPKDPDAPADGGVDAGEEPSAGSSGTAAGGGKGGSSAGKGGSAGAAEGGKGGASAGKGGNAGAAEGGTGGTAQAGAPAAGSGGDGDYDDDAGVAPAVCGTRGAAECTADQFCNFEPDVDCGGTDRGGVCEAKPEVCTEDDNPVCGCDSHTYSNACDAHRDGVSVKREGLCDLEECQQAGGRAVHSDGASIPTCEVGETQWNIDGGGDEGSVCCLARTEGQTCGGFAALECGADQFCNYEPEAGGQGCDGTIADAGGVCEATPQACTRESDPVCGCDRHSYGNPCTAHADGVSILHHGACTVSDCETLGGRAVAGIGPAPMCADDEHEVTWIVNDDGSIAIEGMICCVKN